MNIQQALVWGRQKLKEANVSEPDASASVLLASVLNMTRTEIMAHPEKKLTSAQLNRFKRHISRRRKHESVWRIIGRVEFMGLPFRVTKDVLVPRPETELLVQEVLEEVKSYELRIRNEKSKLINSKLNRKSETINHNSSVTILDVGTGSGTIAISLADQLKIKNKKYKIVATDISAKALRVAKKNAKELKVEKFIRFLKADLFPKTSNLSPLTFDLITANLPYILSEEMASLAMDVHHYEPRLALDGGRGGLEIYDRFLSQVGGYIKPGGKIFCEIGINQGKPFTELVGKHLPNARVKILSDLAGIDRIAIIYLTNK